MNLSQAHSKIKNGGICIGIVIVANCEVRCVCVCVCVCVWLDVAFFAVISGSIGCQNIVIGDVAFVLLGSQQLPLQTSALLLLRSYTRTRCP